MRMYSDEEGRMESSLVRILSPEAGRVDRQVRKPQRWRNPRRRDTPGKEQTPTLQAHNLIRNCRISHYAVRPSGVCSRLSLVLSTLLPDCG